MNTYAIPPAITCLMLMGIGAFAFLRNKRSPVNRCFGLFCLSLVIWLFGFSNMYLSTDEKTALLWAKIGLGGVIFIPVVAYHFILVFLNLRRRIIAPLLYILAFISLPLILTNYLYAGIKMHFWGYYPVAGRFYSVFLSMFVLLFGRGVWLLFVHLKKETGRKREQIRYLCLAFGVGTLGMVDYIVKYPCCNIYPFGYICAFLYTVIITTAIVRYRLMDIKVVIKKTTLLALSILILVSIETIPINLLPQTWWPVSLSITVFLVLVLFKIINYIVRLKDEEIHKERFVYRQQLRKHIGDLVRSKTIRELVIYTVRHTITIARLEFCAMALRKKEETFEDGAFKKRIYYRIEKASSRSGRHSGIDIHHKIIEEDSPLVRYFHNSRVEWVERGQLIHLLHSNPSHPEADLFQEIILQMEELGSELIFFSVANQKLVGMLFLGHKLDGSVYSEEDLDLFRLLSNQAAESIFVLITREENIDLILASCQVTLAALQQRDQYTRGHTERVKEIALRLAMEEPLKSQVHKTPDGFRGLEIAAQLHDLGKIGIPDNILNKKGMLTEEEFKEIILHPQKALLIIGPISTWLGDDILKGIVQHHEHYGGTGYPHKLDNDKIHIYARIIHLADAVDAMTSERPYRMPLTLDAAVVEVKNCAEIQFDPQAVEVFLKLYEQGEIKRLLFSNRPVNG